MDSEGGKQNLERELPRKANWENKSSGKEEEDGGVRLGLMLAVAVMAGFATEHQEMIASLPSRAFLLWVINFGKLECNTITLE